MMTYLHPCLQVVMLIRGLLSYVLLKRPHLALAHRDRVFNQEVAKIRR